MNKFFTYFSGTIYSVKECLLTWKKPKIYPILTFIISFMMLLAPVQFSFVTVPVETVIKQVPNVELVLDSVADELNSKNIDVSIKEGVLEIEQEYQSYLEGFTIYIGSDFNTYPEIDEKKAQKTDNLLIIGKDKFYSRYYDRNSKSISSLSGTYKRVGNFSFDDIYECEDEMEFQSIVGGFLKAIYLSNSSYNLITWAIIIEIFNLIYVLMFGFLLLYINKKGNRDYKLTYGQSFLTLMGSLTLPAFVSTIIGMINFKWFTISYIILVLIRLMRLSFAQLSRNPSYNQLEIEEDPDDFELKFK